MKLGVDMGPKGGFIECSSTTDDQTPAKECSSFQQPALEETSILNLFSPEILDMILSYLPSSEIFQSRAVCRDFGDVVKRKNFQQARSRLRPVEYYLSPLVFYVRDGLWHILGLDYEAKLWRALPPFPPAVPAPDTDLFKDFLVACHRGLFLANVGKPSEPEKLLVCNPLTESTRRLPPLMRTHHPVVLHLRVALTKTSFLVIAVGSSATGTASLSRKTEVARKSPLVYYVRDELWHILGLDYGAKLWRALPPFPPPVPAPDTDLFKDFVVACHRGLFLANVGKPSEPVKLLVCNPLTGLTLRLPPLMHTRHPVLLHLRVALTKTSFLVIAVGSSTSGTKSLSRKTEVYDSAKGEWAEAGDVPGCDFSLNEYQTGVFCERENLLLCVGFMVNGTRGIFAFDIGKREWRKDGFCPFLAAKEIAQPVECDGAIYLFAEQESGRTATHCIDRLDFVPGSPGFVWKWKVTRPRHGYGALLVYPEYTCAPVGQNKLCIFNTIERTGVVYNMSDDPINPEPNESIPAAPPLDDGVVFHSLNPVGYAFEPSFGVSLRGVAANSNAAI